MNVITLPPIMDRTTAGALISQLDSALSSGADLLVEGRDVARIGQCGLQLMLSAQRTAHARGAQMRVHASAAMRGVAEIAGLSKDLAWLGEGND